MALSLKELGVGCRTFSLAPTRARARPPLFLPLPPPSAPRPPLGGVLEASWAVLEPSWAPIWDEVGGHGPFLGLPKASWAPLGRPWKHLRSLLEAS